MSLTDFPNLRLCIGGTFDPIHNGHLRLGAELGLLFPAAKLIFIPLAKPVHRQLPQISQQHRLRMVKLALDGTKDMEASAIEINRAGESYTIETLQQLKVLSPDNIFCWVIGSDVFQHLSKWHQVERLHKFCHMIVVSRAGYVSTNADFSQATSYDFKVTHEFADLNSQKSGLLYHCSLPLLDISSTRIRQLLLRDGGDINSVKWLIPEKIQQYIFNNQLYKSIE